MIDIEAFRHTGEIIGKMMLLAVFFFIILAVLFIPITIIAISTYGNIDFNELLDTTLFQQAQFYVQFVSFIGAVIVMYAIFERGKGLALGWKQARPTRNALVGAVWGFAIATIMFLLIWVSGGLHIVNIALNAQVLKGMAYAIVLFGFVAVYEELLIRGYIQGIVRRRFGVLVAIIVATFSFVCLQLMVSNVVQSPITLLNLLGFGLLLSLLREVSGGLWLPIGLHVVWRFFESFVYGIDFPDYALDHTIIEMKRSGSQYISGGQAGVVGSLIMLLVFAAGTAYVWQRYRRAKVT